MADVVRDQSSVETLYRWHAPGVPDAVSDAEASTCLQYIKNRIVGNTAKKDHFARLNLIARCAC